MCTALKTANFFLSAQTEDASDAISNMKLQKLLYYAQGYHLALFDKELFADDFEAWEHGPVIPHLFRAFHKFGSGAIPKPSNFTFTPYSEQEKSFLRDVYDTFGQYSAWALRELSHQTDPWKNTPRNGIITKESMSIFFKKEIASEK